MFVILFYDVGEKRVSKMLKCCRKYLIWIQNSVFEGKISKANFEKLLWEISTIINKNEGDSVVIYKFRTMKYSDKIIIGLDKKDEAKFI